MAPRPWRYPLSTLSLWPPRSWQGTLRCQQGAEPGLGPGLRLWAPAKRPRLAHLGNGCQPLLHAGKQAGGGARPAAQLVLQLQQSRQLRAAGVGGGREQHTPHRLRGRAALKQTTGVRGPRLSRACPHGEQGRRAVRLPWHKPLGDPAVNPAPTAGCRGSMRTVLCSQPGGPKACGPRGRQSGAGAQGAVQMVGSPRLPAHAPPQASTALHAAGWRGPQRAGAPGLGQSRT